MRRWMTPLYQHRRHHPVLRWVQPRINRQLGLELQLEDYPLYWTPAWVWRDLLREAGYDEETIPQVRAFAADGSVYLPEGGAWYSVLHEALHVAGLDERLGNPYLVEGLTEAVEHEIGRLWLERQPTRGPYAERKRWVRRVLLPATGYRKATELSADLLSVPADAALGRLTELLVTEDPQLDPAEVAWQLGSSNAERPELGLPGDERFGKDPELPQQQIMAACCQQLTVCQPVLLTPTPTPTPTPTSTPTPTPTPTSTPRRRRLRSSYGGLASSMASYLGMEAARRVKGEVQADLPLRIYRQLQAVEDTWEVGDEEEARDLAERAARLMRRLHRRDPDHPVLWDSLELSAFVSGDEPVPRLRVLSLDPDRLPVPAGTSRFLVGSELSATGQPAYSPEEAMAVYQAAVVEPSVAFGRGPIMPMVEYAKTAWANVLTWFNSQPRGVYRLLRTKPGQSHSTRAGRGRIWVGTISKRDTRKMVEALDGILDRSRADVELFTEERLYPDEQGTYWTEYLFYDLM